MKKITIFLAMLHLYGNVQAQKTGTDPGGVPCQYNLRGVVYDSDTRMPLPYAAVWINELDRGVATNDAGEYVLSGLCPGTYTLNIHFVGYNELRDTLVLKGDSVRNYFLEEGEVLLEEVTVQGIAIDNEPIQPKVSLSPIELQRSRGKSLGEALTAIPGVNTLQTGPSISKPVIHGLHSNRVLILNNGVRQEGQQWGSEHAPEIDPFVATELSVIKGAAGVRYGSDAIGGVVLVEPAPLPDSTGIGGEINLVGMTNGRQGVGSGIVEGNLRNVEGLAWRLQGTAKKAGNIKTPRYYLSNSGMEELNFSAETGYKKPDYGVNLFFSHFNSKIGIFSGSHIGNIKDLQSAFERDKPALLPGFSYDIGRPYQDVTHNLFKASSFYDFEHVGKLHLIYARQLNNRKEFDAVRTGIAAGNEPQLDFKITTHTVETVLEHKAIGSFKGSMGLSGIRQENVFSGRKLIPNFESNGGGIFWIEKWSKNNIELESGVRYDYKWIKTYEREDTRVLSEEFVFSNFSGTIGGLYHFLPNFSMGINFATAWRAPSINELFSDGVHHGASAFERGNKSLIPETAYNLSATFKYANSRLMSELTLYNNYIDNFIYLEPQYPDVILTIRGAFPLFEYKQVDANLKGIDANLAYNIIPVLSLSTKISMVRAWNRTENEYLVLIPPDKYSSKLNYTINGLEPFKDLIISAHHTFVNEQSRVPDESDFVPPPSAYHLFGLDLNWSAHVLSHEVQFGLSADNILNTVYRDYMNRFRYYADEMGRNFTLNIKIPF